jgi:hypothetical protein
MVFSARTVTKTIQTSLGLCTASSDRMTAARLRPATTTIVRRSQRSANTPAKGPKTNAGKVSGDCHDHQPGADRGKHLAGPEQAECSIPEENHRQDGSPVLRFPSPGEAE